MRSPTLAASIAAIAVFAAVQWSTLPTSPVGADAPTTAFSEERAAPVVLKLADDIGHRTAGTEGATQALVYLTETMRAIPGLEVEVQDVMDYAMGPYSGPSIFRVRNVVARLPGEIPDAVLVAAHYDSATNSVGAADDALGVAAVVETARALAAGPRPYRSVVFLLDEGEELGLFGAQGFLRHRWAKDVVTFVNLEAAGARGRPILFQTGPGDPWLAGFYARNAPHPHGSVMAQDVFQSGLIPSDTDFRVYRDDAGLRGLDVALYRDGWAYHTHLDRSDRLEAGSLQEMGDNALGVVRALANDDIPSGHVDSPAVYYDVLGLFMISYGQPVGWGLGLIALALLGHALRRVVRLRDVGVSGLLRGTVWSATAIGLGCACGVAIGAVVGGALERGGGWYARPWLALLGFGVPAALVVSGGMRVAFLRSRASLEGTVASLLGGCGVVFGALLVVATWAGLGSAYFPLWWTLGAVAALQVTGWGPNRYGLASVAAFVLPGLLTISAAEALVATFAPMSGRMPVAMDTFVAALAAGPTAVLVAVPAVLAAAVPPVRGRRAAGIAACVGLIAIVALLVVRPYTAERPKRVFLEIRSTPGGETHELFSMDAVPLDDPRARVVNPLKAADPLDVLPPAELRVVLHEMTEPRRVHLRLDPEGATAVRLDFDPPIRALTVDGGRVELRQKERRAWITFVAPPSEGLELVLEVDAPGPQLVKTTAIRRTFDAAFHETMRLLPDWAALDAHAYVVTELEF